MAPNKPRLIIVLWFNNPYIAAHIIVTGTESWSCKLLIGFLLIFQEIIKNFLYTYFLHLYKKNDSFTYLGMFYYKHVLFFSLLIKDALIS